MYNVLWFLVGTLWRLPSLKLAFAILFVLVLQHQIKKPSTAQSWYQYKPHLFCPSIQAYKGIC